MMTPEQRRKKEEKDSGDGYQSVFEQATGDNEGGEYEDNY